MRHVHRPICALAAALWAGGAPSAALGGEIAPEGLDALPPAHVVILGEVHDNPLHHANQARAVAALQPSALVFEMLTAEQAARVTPALRADPEALGAALEWEQSGWPDFADYYPIFAAAPEAAIYGGGLPREEVRRAMGVGAAFVFGPDAGRFGLADPLPPEQQAAREALKMAAHCDMLPEEVLPGMVEAQRLRDAELARATLEAFGDTGGPVVLITGWGHARRDWGVPAVLAQAAPQLSVLTVGQIEGAAVGDQPFDYWIATEPVPRDDPCDVFR